MSSSTTTENTQQTFLIKENSFPGRTRKENNTKMHSQKTARTSVTKTINRNISIGEATIAGQNKNRDSRKA